MDFSLSKEHEHFRREIIDFCETELQGEPTSPADLVNHAVSPPLIGKVVEKGWAGLRIPMEYGGLGRDAICQVIFNEEMSYRRAPIPVLLWNHSFSLFGRICLKHGTEEQKKKWLPRVARGEGIAQGFTEPEAGTDLSRIETRALRQGDHYIINGQKIFSSGIPGNKHGLLMARTDVDAPLEKGISMFILDYSSPGINAIPMKTIGGLMPSTTFFDGVKIPCEDLIGEENKGFDYYMEDRPFYLNKSPGAEVGALQRTYEDLVQYVRETRMEGRLISQDPAIRQKMAQMATEIQAMRFLTYRMAWMETQRLDISLIATVVRVFTVEANLRFNNFATQFLGLEGQLAPDSNYAPIGGLIEWLYRFDALQWFNRGGISYAKTVIATQGLGLPELHSSGSEL
jgi:alkylation response protein AidB-like acyl-CoA dehydrogenase